jgi:transcriptional regulator with XRE-family HTH domain
LRNLGANVRRERVRRGLTQAELAEKADLALRNIQRIEAGEINILVTTALRIQHALACPWEALLGKAK